MKVIFKMNRAVLPGLALCVACGATGADSADSGLVTVGLDAPGGSDPGARGDLWLERFLDGDAKFETPFLETQGLGPVYIRTSCAACHASDGRGPGTVKKMVLVGDDGATPLDDQSGLPWGHTVRPYVAGGASTPLDATRRPGRAARHPRMPPPVLGRGYVDAVLDSEIERVATEQAARTDGIRGRPNYVTYQSERNPDNEFHAFEFGDAVIGRFGLKARIATADDFAADAFQGDMSLTSPFRPDELPNPDALVDDDHPGTDLDIDTVERTADYIRLLEIPQRVPNTEGAQVFDDVGCAVCHAPSLRTRADYPVPALADVDAPIYSDLLLHDMGTDLADGMEESRRRSARLEDAAAHRAPLPDLLPPRRQRRDRGGRDRPARRRRLRGRRRRAGLPIPRRPGPPGAPRVRRVPLTSEMETPCILALLRWPVRTTTRSSTTRPTRSPA